MLHEEGVAILLAYGGALFPPKDGHPGMRCTVDTKGEVLIEPVSYPCATTRARALEEARQVCVAADLEVIGFSSVLMVRKRP